MCKFLGGIAHLTHFTRALVYLDSGRQGTCAPGLWTPSCGRGLRMQAHGGVSIIIQHVPRPAVLGLHRIPAALRVKYGGIALGRLATVSSFRKQGTERHS